MFEATASCFEQAGEEVIGDPLRVLRMGEDGTKTETSAAMGQGDEEAGGFIFTRETMEALTRLDLTKISRSPANRGWNGAKILCPSDTKM